MLSTPERPDRPQPPGLPFDTEELLAQVGWVRALALRIAGDVEVAEDLTQDALLVALKAEAERPRSIRRWLAAVVRNLNRSRVRSEERRKVREASVAVPEARASVLELVERAALQRELVGVLLELDEPYRSTLLLRFFEECTQREIAERMDVPVSTVGTRIAEGLRRLRTKLKAEPGGDGRARLSALAPLLRWSDRPLAGSVAASGAGTLVSGALLMGTKTKVAVVLSLLVGAFVVQRVASPPTRPTFEPAKPVETRAAIAEPRHEEVRAQRPIASDVRTPAVLETARTPGEPVDPHHGLFQLVSRAIHGRVIDLDGLPVPGVEIRRVPWPGEPAFLVRGPEGVTSDSEGRFEFVGNVPQLIGVRSERFAAVREGFATQVGDAEVAAEVDVVVSWRIPLEGVVVDEAAHPIPDAVVSVLLPPGRLSSLGLALESSRLVQPSAVSDVHGAFSFGGIPEVRGTRLEARAPGYAARELELPEGGSSELRIVLERESSALRIAGRVLLPDGTPAAEAHVSAGHVSFPTDDEGFFVVDLGLHNHHADREAELRLSAVAPGFLPTTVTLPSVAATEETGRPGDLVLQLGSVPLKIEGRVVDEEGEPFVGLTVAVRDPTPFGLVRVGRDAYGFMPRSLEEMAGGGDARTHRDGRFELGGLLEQSYVLDVFDRESLLSLVTEPVEAGQRDVELVLDRSALGRIAGRVVDREGRPMSGVRVAVSRRRTTELVIGNFGMSDENGLFSIERVVPDPPYLRIEGEEIVPELFREIPVGADSDALVLAVGRRCHLQVDWGDWQGRADELVVIGEDGAPIEMMSLQGGGFGVRPALTVDEGLSEVVAVSDAVTHAVLRMEGQEVSRVKLRPVPGEVEVIRP